MARMVIPEVSSQGPAPDAVGSPGTLSHHWSEAAPLAPPAKVPGVVSLGDELQAIVINPQRRVAVINGRTVGVGNDVAWNGESWTVDSIESKCVVLSQQDGERQIGLIIKAGGTTEVSPAHRSTAKSGTAAPALLPHADSALRRNALR
ncbi:MAG: hypothetical protein IT428_14270 [Planctomycetaceae bacterium]|nr:hypothetical protein [Planctomycetaceae bacterium]